MDSLDVDDVESEREDRESSIPAFEILTYPADYTLEVLIDKWRKQQIIIPPFQRRFVWSRVQASKLIESFLLGLPVPAIFLYSVPEDNSLLVVDGQQRLKTIAYYFEGYFGDEEGGRRHVFRLIGLDEHSPFAYKSYEDLNQEDTASFNKLNDSVLRAFVIKQLNPADDTSIYHVFERLNTGGTFLLPQEIRNAIYRGFFNDFLLSINGHALWRAILGKPGADKRQRDVELVLRVLALYFDGDNYDKPMKNFLNKFMRKNQQADQDTLEQFQAVFESTTEVIHGTLGPRPFHIRTGLNAAVLDSVYTATAQHLAEIPDDFSARYKALVADEEYLSSVSSRTTNTDVVERRIERASEVLFS